MCLNGKRPLVGALPVIFFQFSDSPCGFCENLFTLCAGLDSGYGQSVQRDTDGRQWQVAGRGPSTVLPIQCPEGIRNVTANRLPSIPTITWGCTWSARF